jgi:hypothetical protein
MPTGKRAMTATMRTQMQMRMRISRKKHRKAMLDQRRMWRIHLRPSDVGRYQGKDGDHADADVDEEEEAWPLDDGSTQNVED